MSQVISDRNPPITLSPEMVHSTSSHNSTPEHIVSDDVEVSSPNKRRKAIAKGKKIAMPKGKRLDMDCEERVVGGKGSPNKRWDPHCSDYAIEVLAELAKQGLKVDKSFKRQAFVNCASAVNERFNESYSPENVANHLRTLKTKWNHITFVRNLSGAGFDDEQKMVVLIGKPLEDIKKSHPSLMCYVNKPLKLYEELRIVAGEDQATGSYKKGVYHAFGSIPILVPNTVIDLENEKKSDSRSTVPENVDGGGRSSGEGRFFVNAKPTRSTSSTRSGSGRKRPANDDAIDHLIDKVGDMTSVLAIAQKEKTDEKMSEALFSMVEFELGVLDKAFEKLYSDPDECRKFIARPPIARRIWLQNFKAQQESTDDSH